MAKKTSVKRTREAKGAPVVVLPTTQRAYTLRLRGTHSTDQSWRNALWATHEAINKGAKVFGDWLLTLRGGLCHTLAEPPLPAKGTQRSEDETYALRKNRRILLALSWLSVEDARGAPDGERAGQPVRVAGGEDTPEVRKDKVLAALRAMLTKRGLSAAEIEAWVADCAASLASRIRDDAVWINRSACFDTAVADIGPTLTRDEVWDVLEPYFTSRESYLAPVELAEDEDGRSGEEEKAKKLAQMAGKWLVLRSPKAAGADFAPIVERYKALRTCLSTEARAGMEGRELAERMAAAIRAASAGVHDLESAFTYTGAKKLGRFFTTLREIVNEALITDDRLKAFRAAVDRAIESFEKKAAERESTPRERRPLSDRVLADVARSCGFEYSPENDKKRHFEYCVVFGHAARRVSSRHSSIKRAEAQRRQFEADEQKLESVPERASQWLDGFLEERGGKAGGDYRIRRRAIEGWEKVVERWSRKECATADDRIKAARELQDDREIEKFGDIQLFEALAADDAMVVWRSAGGKPDPQALKDYVQGHDARFRRRHYKVPAYRHPDPLRHPVFGDFGKSQWTIAYAAHKAAKAAGSQRRPDAARAAFLRERHGLKMTLWTGGAMEETVLRWSSKRLSTDLALDLDREGQAMRTVTRADRLGRAAAGFEQDEVPSAAALFALEDWNGRLQAPRAELDAIARRIEKHGWDATAHGKRDRLSWLVSFSAKLECRGPFVEYGVGHGLIDPTREIELKPRNTKNEWRGLSYPFWHPANDGHKGNAKHLLSRLPGLRVLSVDLGHRFAASCAVWVTLSRAAFTQDVAERIVVSGGTASNDLFCHTRHTDPNTGKEKTTIYRRVGADLLPDGESHPAPWARLDRQFLIKLQGEETPPRKASEAEREAVAAFERSIGRERAQPHDQLPMRVDKLMSEAVRSARLGLRRHGDAARIAYAFMTGSVRHKSGGATEEHTDETRTAAVLDALVRWQSLCGQIGSRWRDAATADFWQAHIAPRLSEALPDLADDASGPQRKAHRKQIEELLKPLAKQLAQTGNKGQPELHKAWSEKWTADHARWQQHLKWLSRWLLPRRIGRLKPLSPEGFAKLSQRGREDLVRQLDVADPAVGERLLEQLNTSIHERNSQTGRYRAQARNVGGLSLTRIATMRELWQVQKAFHYGAEPNDLRAGVRRIEDDSARGVKFGQRALDSMERMREQRVKQIASRIAASALGLGGHWKSVPRKDSSGRPLLDQDGRQRTKHIWIEEPSPKYSPCHAVVIENLRNYRPDELQTRRENKVLMSWSSAKVAKYLGEACQLNGLHLREVSPNYTSRQCSRTGLPGLRCVDVSVNAENAEPDIYWWKKTFAAAEKKTGTNGTSGDAESRFIVALAQHLKKLKESNAALPKSVRLPRRGGDLFVAAPSWKDIRAARLSASAAVQADLNAAANVGLRALLDPDFAGHWWYVPCDTASGKPAKDKCAGAACLDLDTVLLKSDDVDGEKPKKARGKSREVTNAWHDITEKNGWKQHTPYWNDVTARVIERLRAANGLD